MHRQSVSNELRTAANIGPAFEKMNANEFASLLDEEIVLYYLTKHNLLVHILNPIALRKTKIAHNFGLSECNRVNKPLTELCMDLEPLIYHICSKKRMQATLATKQ